MTTVAQIAARALNGVAARITDAVHAATVTRATRGAYNTTTGAYAVTTASQTGRAVFATETPIIDVFPEYVIGPGDQLILLEGMAGLKETDALVIGSVTRTIRAVQNIAGAGSVYYVVAR